MATFFEKTGQCMERKNNVQVDPEDSIRLLRYRLDCRPATRYSIADDLLLQAYNQGLQDDKKFKNFGGLYDQLNKNSKVRGRVNDIIRNFGMSVQDIRILFSYKVSRNKIVHRDCLNRGATAPILYQQLQDALLTMLIYKKKKFR